MKQTLLGLAMLIATAMPATTSAAGGNVHFKGELKGLKDSLIVMTPGQGNDLSRDTVIVKDGKFDFSVSVAEPTLIYAYTPATLRRQEQVGFRVIAVPGETAVLKGDIFSGFEFSGTVFYRQYNEANHAVEAAGKAIDAFTDSLNIRLKAGESSDSLTKIYQARMPIMQQQMIEDILAFIKTHPSYEASAAIIPLIDELDKMNEAAKLLSPDVREGRMKPYYQDVIDREVARQQAKREAAVKQAAGVEAPDFTLNDINGKPLSLSSLRGKYVVLDFWGSWCVWCIKGFPEMKKYYEKYKGKFEILGIDCNDTEDKWKAAVSKHALPWLQVYCPRNSKVLSDYAVQGFPTKIIVGPDGKIARTVVGEDPMFYTFLDEFFGKQ